MSAKPILAAIALGAIGMFILGCGSGTDEAGFQPTPKGSAPSSGGPEVGAAEGPNAPKGGSDVPSIGRK